MEQLGAMADVRIWGSIALLLLIVVAVAVGHGCGALVGSDARLHWSCYSKPQSATFALQQIASKGPPVIIEPMLVTAQPLSVKTPTAVSCPPSPITNR